MVEKGINVKTLSTKMGITPSTLYRKLDGTAKITIGEAMKMKEALSMTTEEATEDAPADVEVTQEEVTEAPVEE